jgi:hypothetical protein
MDTPSRKKGAMPFLKSQLDLTNTIFTDNDLQKAREYLSIWITREKPSWLKNPQGPFGDYWRQDDVQSACHLIDLARMIDILTGKLSQQSIPHLFRKVRKDLLRRPSDMQQFNETLAELQVAFEFVTYVSPLMLEPHIPDQMRAPDFAFQLPEGMVYLDVTVFRGGPLERWEEARERIKSAIERRIIKRKMAVSVGMQLPLENINIDQIINQVLEKIDERDSGEMVIGEKGMIRWEPFSMTVIPDGSDSIPVMSSSLSAYHTPGVTVDIAFGLHTDISTPLPEDVERANELLFKSVCTKLKQKHDQFPGDQPSLLVIKLGHWRLITDGVLDMLRNRIWKKDDYRWITGIIFFRPRRGFLRTDEDSRLILSVNPRAKCQASESLVSIFRDGARFHY